MKKSFTYLDKGFFIITLAIGFAPPALSVTVQCQIYYHFNYAKCSISIRTLAPSSSSKKFEVRIKLRTAVASKIIRERPLVISFTEITA